MSQAPGHSPQVDSMDGGTDLGTAVRALWQLTLQLRRECPWDRAQTAATIAPYTIEETYEVVDAVVDAEAAVASGDRRQTHSSLASLEDELGDLLFQVMFLAMWCNEHDSTIDVGTVAQRIHAKLVRRHPHVFGDAGELASANEVRGAWEQIKRTSEGRDQLFDGIPRSMPALNRARKVQRRAASVGFDFARAEAALDKLEEEVGELRSAITEARIRASMADDEGTPADPDVASECGDVLFAAVNVARLGHVDPESALGATTQKFVQRVSGAVDFAQADGVDFGVLDLAQQESYYQRAKLEISGNSAAQ